MTKAIFVDVSNEMVRAFAYDDRHPDSLKSLYMAINCGTITSARLSDGVSAFVDDEGLWTHADENGNVRGFVWHDDGGSKVAQLAGNAVLVGPPDEEGYSTDCPLTVEEVRKRITFGEFVGLT